MHFCQNNSIILWFIVAFIRFLHHWICISCLLYPFMDILPELISVEKATILWSCLMHRDVQKKFWATHEYTYLCMNKIELTQNTVTSETTVMTMQGYLAKIWESPKLVIEQKCPSSQIPFFTYKPSPINRSPNLLLKLAKFGLSKLIQIHPNSSEFIWITKFGYLGDLNNQIFSYLVILLFG